MKQKRALPNLVAILGGLLIGVSLLYPWWSLDIEFIGKTNIFPYIIRGPATSVLGYRTTAQMPLLTGMVIACVVLALVGSFLGRRAGRLALFGSALFAGLAAWRFHARALDIVGRYNMTTVNGETVARVGAFTPLHVAARLEPGFYLNIAGGALCLVAVLLHGFFRPGVPRATEAPASGEQS
jgi:hypothetical protein